MENDNPPKKPFNEMAAGKRRADQKHDADKQQETKKENARIAELRNQQSQDKNVLAMSPFGSVNRSFHYKKTKKLARLIAGINNKIRGIRPAKKRKKRRPARRFKLSERGQLRQAFAAAKEQDVAKTDFNIVAPDTDEHSSPPTPAKETDRATRRAEILKKLDRSR